MSELLIATLAGLGGMMGWGFADFFAKKTIDEIGDVISMVWAHFFGTIIFGLIFYFQFISFPNTASVSIGVNAWILLILFGIFQAIVYLTAYQGFGKGPLSVLNPIFASYSGLAALISILFLGEIVNLPIITTLIIIFIGIILMNLDLDSLKIKKINIALIPGVKEMLFASFVAAFWTVGWSMFVSDKNWLLYAFMMYLFMSITAYVSAKIRKIPLSYTLIPRKIWKFLILIGVFEFIAYASISLGFSLTEKTSIIAVLSGAFSLPTIILARIFLREQPNIIQTIGSLVVISGIIIISIL